MRVFLYGGRTLDKPVADLTFTGDIPPAVDLRNPVSVRRIVVVPDLPVEAPRGPAILPPSLRVDKGELVGVVAGILSTISVRPSEEHPMDMLENARWIVATVLAVVEDRPF